MLHACARHRCGLVAVAWGAGDVERGSVASSPHAQDGTPRPEDCCDVGAAILRQRIYASRSVDAHGSLSDGCPRR